MKFLVIFLFLIGFVGTVFALDYNTIDSAKITLEENYDIEIIGLKDEYRVGEPYSFSFIISGYGYSCANYKVDYPDENGNVVGVGAEVLCAPETSMNKFKINSLERHKTLGNIGIKKPGVYSVTVTFDKPSKYFPTTITKEFRVVEFVQEKIIPPPLKQMKLGIKLSHIICDVEKYPIWNIHQKPACIFPDSEGPLLTRGWAKLRLVLPASADPIKELEITGQNELSYRFTGNLIVGDETHPLSNDRKRELAWEYSQTHHPDEQYLEYSIPSLQNYHQIGEKIEFDLLEWGNYSDCWNLKLRIIDTKNNPVYEDNAVKYCLEPDGIPGTFNSYSIGDDFEEFVCNKPGYYRIEVSNGIVYSPAILQNFVCLDTKSEPINEPEPEISNKINFSKTTNANNQFAFDYYSQVNKEKNIFFSPWSITSAFAIVNEGARGNTATEIQNVFEFEENSKEDFKSINEILNKENLGYTIEVANSLWLAQDFIVYSDYTDTVQTYYDGVIEKVDFADNGTDVINGWVSEKTQQKIPELFNPPLEPKTRLVIANAIYFNGTWAMPFDEKNTRDDKFIISPGEDVTVPFMNKDSFYIHTTTDELQIIELPYESNGASMLILLPERIDGISSLEKQLTAKSLEKWRSEMTKSRLFLQIPKFTLETEYNLIKDLMVLGIIDAFGPADFSGISSESLFIDRAVHKAFVDVNEKGTEAAAATGVAMEESMPPTFRADHPFVFVILDNETGNILFLGKVVDPS